MVPVVILDQDKQTRTNLSLLLSASGIRVEQFTLPAKYLESKLFSKPHIAVISLELEGFDGLDIVRFAVEKSGALAVFASLEKPDTVKTVAAMRLGCADVLEKPIRAEPLIKAATGALDRPTSKSAVPDKQQALKALTGREQDVLKGLLANQTNKHIARDLKVSVRTVESHRSKLYAKLNVNSHAELIKKWTV